MSNSATATAAMTSAGTSNGPSSAADVDTGISTTDDMILDFNSPADMGPSLDCGGGMGNPEGFQCEQPLDPKASAYGCLALIDEGCPPFSDLAVAASLQECLGLQCQEIQTACGPDPSQPAACCYWVEFTGQICPGRPFTVDGEARLAPLATDPRWPAPCSPSLSKLDPELRRALANAWAEDGRFEHASVASFSRFVLHLLALGAPPSLIADAQRAAAEELEHARAFFGIASAYAGHPLGAGPLDIQGGLRDSDDATAIVVSAVKEGCIAETISALQIAAAREGARDPAIRKILTRIAEQELEHAELAWRFVAWMLPRGDDRLRAAVAEAFAQADRAIPRTPAIPEGLSDERLLARGRLSEHRQQELTRDALDRVVGPCAAALLEPWTTLASSATAARPISLAFS